MKDFVSQFIVIYIQQTTTKDFESHDIQQNVNSIKK